MEIKYDFINDRFEDNDFIRTLINDDISLNFGDDGSRSDKIYVVNDATLTALCVGTLEECYFYRIWYKEYRGFDVDINSKEKYYEIRKDYFTDEKEYY